MSELIKLDERYSATRRVLQSVSEVSLERGVEQKSSDQFEVLLVPPADENRQSEGGLRTKGFLRKSEKNKPLITVVTVVFNGEQLLEKTIQSVINQTYDNVEYIIVDGGSTDGTLDIIHNYEHAIDYWFSAQDKGIYDAMNKGIELASGDWLNFMNSGDKFKDEIVLRNIFVNEAYDCDFLVGSAIANASWGSLMLNVRPEVYVWKSFCHQSVFVNCRYFKQHLFDLSYLSASDFNYLYLAYVKGAIFKSINQVVSVVLYVDSGFSALNANLSKREVLRSIISMGSVVQFSTYKHFSYHLVLYFKSLTKVYLMRYFPVFLNKIRRVRDQKKSV
jgi:glycosyltransferase involved in cell wall biosynthesis